MKLLVGLGNPGSQYERTRHNAGFMAVDVLLRRHAGGGNEIARSRFSSLSWEVRIGAEKVLLLKPTTYMNLSGRAVAEAVGFYKLDPSSDLLVLVDEASFDCGQVRVNTAGSAGGHNGLSDIERALGTQAYPRLRIGVGPRPAEFVLTDYVLGRFTDEQAALLGPALETAGDAGEAFVTDGVDAAMNRFNRRPGPAPGAAQQKQ